MPTYIWMDLWGPPLLVGAAEITDKNGSFQYAPSHVKSGRPSIDPQNLPLAEERYYTRANDGLFGVLGDAGPDAWGKRVLTALHPKRMATAGPLDVLMMAGGHGTGALLFSGSRDQVKPRGGSASLSDLGAAAEGMQTVELGGVPKGHLRDLMEFGTSLGGVHPKIAVTDGAVEWIAKFRSREDIVNVPRIECATMELARKCGINAAAVKLSAVGEHACTLVRRFDCIPGGRLHYLSAHALWNVHAVRLNEATRTWASYMGIADLLRLHVSADPRADCEELFRRMAFNVVIGNTDDHGKNHGFLMTPDGTWRLAPAFDVTPTIGSPATQQALGIGLAGRERSFENLLSATAKFGLAQPQAERILHEVSAGVAKEYVPLLDAERVPPQEIEAVQARLMFPQQ
jgi:serine/threonine-protein kinase HipA